MKFENNSARNNNSNKLILTKQKLLFSHINKVLKRN